MKKVEPPFPLDDDLQADVQTIMARIQESLVERVPEDDVEYPTHAAARARYGEPARFSQEMYYQLEQANLNHDQIWVALSLVESRTPLVGRLVNRLKCELHRLVIYYVNMLGGRQATVNKALVHTLNPLVEKLEPPAEANPTIEALQREIDDLQARLEKLEAQAKLEE
ncbi:MAG: hypothetical protein PVF45_06050 [Anaerolineae bacterium]